MLKLETRIDSFSEVTFVKFGILGWFAPNIPEIFSQYDRKLMKKHLSVL